MEHVCVGGTYAHIINIQSLQPCLRSRSEIFPIESPFNQPLSSGICIASFGADWRVNAATNGDILRECPVLIVLLWRRVPAFAQIALEIHPTRSTTMVGNVICSVERAKGRF